MNPIPFTGTFGLFTRLGAVFGAVEKLEVWQKTSIPSYATNILNSYYNYLAPIGTANPIATLVSDTDSAVSLLGSAKRTLTQYLAPTVQQMVQASIDVPATDTATLWNEIISQMNAASPPQTIQNNTITSTVTTNLQDTSHGWVWVYTGLSSGAPMQYVYAENITITCTSDGQGSSTAPGPGTAIFSALGGVAAPSMLSSEWPMGSGASLTLAPFNPDSNAGSQNYLTNSNFEAWVANVPTGWTITTGTAGTTVVQGTQPYRGLYSLGFVGNGTELTSITQSLGTQIKPSTVYCLMFRVMTLTSETTGALAIQLVGTTNGVSTYYKANVPLGFLSAGIWGDWPVMFVTPALLAESYSLEIAVSTAIPSGVTVYVDDVALAPMQQFGNGPFLAIQPGSQIFVKGEQFNLAMTNDYGSQLGTLLWRTFQLDSLGIVVPNSGDPTIPDTIITN